MIRVICVKCNSILPVPEDKGGKKVQCPKCYSVLNVPNPTSVKKMASPARTAAAPSQLPVMSWWKKLFGQQGNPAPAEKIAGNSNLRQPPRQTTPVIAKPAAAPSATTLKIAGRTDDDELRKAVQEIEKLIRGRNDPKFPIISLTVERQSEGTCPVLICLPEDRAKVAPSEDVCIVWLYPNDKGLAYAEAEGLLRNTLKPLGYKLNKPRNTYGGGEGPSHYHWIVQKVKIEAEPPVIEATRVLEGHGSFVNCVCYSPDGKTLASGAGAYGDSDNTVRLWEADTGKQLACFKGSTDSVAGIAYSSDGELLASVGSVICLWDVASGKPKLTFGEMYGQRGPVRATSVCFSPDGKMVVCGCSDATIRMWDAETGSQIRELCGHRKGVKSVRFSPNGRFLASGSFDGTVRIWDATTGAEVRTLQGHSQDVIAVSYSPDGATVASASEDRTVRIWDTATGKLLRSLAGHDDEVTSVCYSPDGKILGSGSKDKTVRLWDATTGKQLFILKGHTDGLGVSGISFAPNGLTLASSGSSDKTVRLWAIGSSSHVVRAPETPAKAPDATLKKLADRIARGDAATIGEFASTQEANARAQAQIDASYAAESAYNVKVFLLESQAQAESRRFLLINIGTRDSLCRKYEAFNNKGLFRKLKESLTESEANAISPVPGHENFSLPGMDLLPGDHLKTFVDAISRNEYRQVQVSPPSALLEVVSKWKQEQTADQEKTTSLGARVVRCTLPCQRDWKVSEVKVHEATGGVLGWQCPKCGRNYLEAL